ncbi:MAG TPA: tRNA pseudouridine(55) synthase TruB [Gemmataceae bacterium]|nr:tRNA pseudouridine(55) synthase TruB [Gemmataceae bacterium]
MQPRYHGLLVIDKPGGLTSRDVVNRLQRCFAPRTRIGHTGTLDPLATGVLVICAGNATRLVEYVQRMGKTYVARLRLGAESDTDDADGRITPTSITDQPPSRTGVEAVLREFIGEVEQVPPAYSAALVTGRRAHDLARRGIEVDLKARRVQIFAIDLLGFNYPGLELRVDCGKGTYIRSLARDLGRRLGCGAYVETLRRTRVGPFDAQNALSLDSDASLVREHILPCASAVAELPHLHLSADDISRLRHGQPVHCAGLVEADEFAVFDQAQNLVAIASRADENTLAPSKVLNWDEITSE